MNLLRSKVCAQSWTLLCQNLIRVKNRRIHARPGRGGLDPTWQFAEIHDAGRSSVSHENWDIETPHLPVWQIPKFSRWCPARQTFPRGASPNDFHNAGKMLCKALGSSQSFLSWLAWFWRCSLGCSVTCRTPRPTKARMYAVLKGRWFTSEFASDGALDCAVSLASADATSSVRELRYLWLGSPSWTLASPEGSKKISLKYQKV